MESGNPYAPPQSPIALDGALESALPLASRGARLGARLLDGLVEGTIPMLGAITSAAMTSSSGEPALAPMALAYLVGFGVWVYQLVRLLKTGQTLGKKWAGVKVVRLDGGNPTFGSHFLRGLVFAFLTFISPLFIFREDRRCLHDLAGETKVIAV